MKRGFMALAAVVAFAAGCGTSGPQQAGARPQAALAAKAAGTPVLLVHGHHGAATNFDAMVPRLRAAGYAPHALDFVTAGWTDWTLDELARQVGMHVLALKAKSGQDRVDVVAHSLGGIAVRQYLKFHGGERHVRRLVCLGSPHHGVGFGAIALWQDVGRLFAPHGPVLNRLNRPDETHGDVQYTNLWSPSDWAEWAPYASGRLVGAFNYRVDKTPHAVYPSDPRVFAAVEASLRRPLDAVPGPETTVGALLGE